MVGAGGGGSPTLCVGDVLGMFGDVLAMCWRCLGDVLATFWQVERDDKKIRLNETVDPGNDAWAVGRQGCFSSPTESSSTWHLRKRIDASGARTGDALECDVRLSKWAAVVMPHWCLAALRWRPHLVYHARMKLGYDVRPPKKDGNL